MLCAAKSKCTSFASSRLHSDSDNNVAGTTPISGICFPISGANPCRLHATAGRACLSRFLIKLFSSSSSWSSSSSSWLTSSDLLLNSPLLLSSSPTQGRQPFFDGVVDLLKRHSDIGRGPSRFAESFRGRLRLGLPN